MHRDRYKIIQYTHILRNFLLKYYISNLFDTFYKKVAVKTKI